MSSLLDSGSHGIVLDLGDGRVAKRLNAASYGDAKLELQAQTLVFELAADLSSLQVPKPLGLWESCLLFAADRDCPPKVKLEMVASGWTQPLLLMEKYDAVAFRGGISRLCIGRVGSEYAISGSEAENGGVDMGEACKQLGTLFGRIHCRGWTFRDANLALGWHRAGKTVAIWVHDFGECRSVDSCIQETAATGPADVKCADFVFLFSLPSPEQFAWRENMELAYFDAICDCQDENLKIECIQTCRLVPLQYPRADSHMNLVFCGPEASKLALSCGAITRRELQDFGAFGFCRLVDSLAQSRDAPFGLDFDTRKRRFTIVRSDCKFTRVNAIVSSFSAEAEDVAAAAANTDEYGHHIYDSHVCVVTDMEVVGWNQGRFESIKDLAKCDMAIPISLKDNVNSKLAASTCSWWSGGCLLDILEHMDEAGLAVAPQQMTRFRVAFVHASGGRTYLSGRSNGWIKKGDVVEVFGEPLQVALTLRAEILVHRNKDVCFVGSEENITIVVSDQSLKKARGKARSESRRKLSHRAID